MIHIMLSHHPRTHTHMHTRTHTHSHLTPQLINQQVLDDCNAKQLCMIGFLPHILDSGASGRNEYIEILRNMGEKYKQRSFG